ncbi:ATP-binding protein [Streptomyces sp. NBC_01716]|uniref:ATP-binding protein n=1 Tax=Streptomyces sp. NBC_01716 TaxID=2975917 RepID=UPI002E316B4F|nr:ATP-binding protein [Streptomyces sp. NBC_01716]
MPPVTPTPTPHHGGESYRLVVPNTAHAPRLAREFVSALLDVSGYATLVDDARICVSELVTNAHRHTRTRQIRVEAVVSRKRATVYVCDSNPWALPVPGEAQDVSEHGQGLRLVESIARGWGLTIYGGCSPSYKAVWFSLARHGVAA